MTTKYPESPERSALLADPVRNQLYRRATLAVQGFSALPSDLRRRLSAESEALDGLGPCPAQAVHQAEPQHFAALADRLSSAFEEVSPKRPLEMRSTAEARVLASLPPEGGLAEEPRDFGGWLLRLNCRLSPELSGWRSGEISLSADHAGNVIFFPAAYHVPEQLVKLREFLFRPELPAIFRAVVALALLTNCHPFNEGNGRTARALFNLILRQGGMPHSVYFPIYEIARRSRGGYQIALRRAELLGDWPALFEYFLKAIECHRRIAAGQ